MIEVVQAFDRAPITQLDSDDATALERKIETAQRHLADRGAWLKPHQRMDVLRRLATLMEGRREHLGCQIAREGGKPLTDASSKSTAPSTACGNAADELRVRAARSRWA